MKKIATLLLLTISCFAFSACSNNKNNTEGSSTKGSAETEVKEETKTKTEEKTETQPETETKTEVTNSANVSDNLFDNQFSFEGTLITMPTSARTFEAFGLSFPADKKDYTLNPNTMTSGRIESADATKKIFIGFYNLGTAPVVYGDCMLSSVSIQKQYFKDSNFVLPKGITFGSTMDEVKAAYGEPTSSVEGDTSASVLRESIRYKNPSNPVDNYFELYFEDKVLVKFDLYVESK